MLWRFRRRHYANRVRACLGHRTELVLTAQVGHGAVNHGTCIIQQFDRHTSAPELTLRVGPRPTASGAAVHHHCATHCGSEIEHIFLKIRDLSIAHDEIRQTRIAQLAQLPTAENVLVPNRSPSRSRWN